MNENLENLWRDGCRGKRLSPEQSKRFAAMARSRFHTFELGLDHAKSNQDTHSDLTFGLIKGMAQELKESPGLKKVWLRMSVSTSDTGIQVNLLLEKFEQKSVH